jgi:hypothetical protein
VGLRQGENLQTLARAIFQAEAVKIAWSLCRSIPAGRIYFGGSGGRVWRKFEACGEGCQAEA